MIQLLNFLFCVSFSNIFRESESLDTYTNKMCTMALKIVTAGDSCTYSYTETHFTDKYMYYLAQNSSCVCITWWLTFLMVCCKRKCVLKDKCYDVA